MLNLAFVPISMMQSALDESYSKLIVWARWSVRSEKFHVHCMFHNEIIASAILVSLHFKMMAFKQMNSAKQVIKTKNKWLSGEKLKFKISVVALMIQKTILLIC